METVPVKGTEELQDLHMDLHTILKRIAHVSGANVAEALREVWFEGSLVREATRKHRIRFSTMTIVLKYARQLLTEAGYAL